MKLEEIDDDATKSIMWNSNTTIIENFNHAILQGQRSKHVNFVIFITGGSHVIGGTKQGGKTSLFHLTIIKKWHPFALHPLRFRVSHSSSSAYINLIFMLQSFKPAIECSKCLYSIWASSLPNYLWHVGLLQILQLLSPLTLLQILLRLWSGNTIYI